MDGDQMKQAQAGHAPVAGHSTSRYVASGTGQVPTPDGAGSTPEPGGTGPVASQAPGKTTSMSMQSLLQLTVERGASDLHLIAGYLPTLRIQGRLTALAEVEVLGAETAKELVLSIMTARQRDEFLANKEIDLSYQFGQLGRFRVNAYFQKGMASAALRLVPQEIRGIDELKLPAVYHQFTKLRHGLVLVTGPTGHGKSSSLAAMIQEINQTRAEHVVTIEDPIEFVYPPGKSMISQREVNSDTHSWERALRSVLREDPDIVLVGEMRDFETIAAALTVAETGHVVFATLHTNSASQTIDRIIDVFPEHQQAQIRMQLAASLEAVLSQRLIPSGDGGRVPAAEILLATPAVKNTIREGKTFQIDNIIQTSAEIGMQTLETSLSAWVRKGAVSLEVATEYALRQEDLLRLVKGGGGR